MRQKTAIYGTKPNHISTPVISRINDHKTISNTHSTSPSRSSSRGDLPSRASSSQRQSSYCDMSDPPHSNNPDGIHPATPTPNKGGRRRRPNGKHSTQRRNRPQAAGTDGDQADGEGALTLSSEDDETLLDLLGVPTPVKSSTSTPGLLPISRDQVEKNKNVRKSQPKANGLDSAKKKAVNGGKGKNRREDRGSISEGDLFSKPRPLRKAKAGRAENQSKTANPSNDAFPTNNNVSGLSASRPPKQSKQKNLPTAEAGPPASLNTSQSIDISSLSKSLPANGGMKPPVPASTKKKSGKGGKGPGTSGDESAVWDMPEDFGPPATQELTWQQKLQGKGSSDSPRRPKTAQSANPNHSAADRKKSRRPVSQLYHDNLNTSRPPNARRLSLDGSMALSAFDTTLPYHTGFNVNRAPQTPAKLPTSQSAAGALPVLHGEFPRLKHGSLGPGGAHLSQSQSHGKGIKYAGPTFHNSPHAASLPKPDLDDF